MITKVERKHEKLKRDYRNCQRELRVLRGRLRSSLLTRLPTLADDGTLERMEHKTLRSQPVQILQSLLFSSNAAHSTAAASTLMLAECSAMLRQVVAYR